MIFCRDNDSRPLGLLVRADMPHIPSRSSIEEDTEIPETDFGYKKHLMAFDLPGKWMIDLPVNLYYIVDENSEVYYDHERNVRSICYTRNDDKSDQEYAD